MKMTDTAKFALLMQEHGYDIDTESHVKTAPSYLRYGGIVCTHSFRLENSGTDVLLYYPLKEYIKNKDSLEIYEELPFRIKVFIKGKA